MILAKNRSRSKKKKSSKNPAHLARVAQLNCVVCGSFPVEVHHLRIGSGLSRKAPDELSIPLCITHHRGQEGFHSLGKRAWEAKYGYQVDHLDTVRKLLSIGSG